MRTVRCNVCLDRFEETGHHTADEKKLIRLVTRDFIEGSGTSAPLCPECIAYFASALRAPLPAQERRGAKRTSRRVAAHPA